MSDFTVVRCGGKNIRFERRGDRVLVSYAGCQRLKKRGTVTVKRFPV